MEKLIKLLNEHRAELLNWNIQNKPMRHYSGYVFWLSDLTEQNCILLVISKEYGFIKWLVDNDKIDQTVIDWNFWYFCMEWFDTVDSLLMVLAISDTPIDFLCEIIKK